MKQQIEKLSDDKRQLIVDGLTNSLLMPTGDVAAAAVAAVLVVIFVLNILGVT
jgi:hypothetical protein